MVCCFVWCKVLPASILLKLDMQIWDTFPAWCELGIRQEYIPRSLVTSCACLFVFFCFVRTKICGTMIISAKVMNLQNNLLDWAGWGGSSIVHGYCLRYRESLLCCKFKKMNLILGQIPFTITVLRLFEKPTVLLKQYRSKIARLYCCSVRNWEAERTPQYSAGSISLFSIWHNELGKSFGFKKRWTSELNST